MKGKVYYSVVYDARVLIWPKTLVSYHGGWGSAVEKSTTLHWHCAVTGMNIDIYGGPNLTIKEFSTGFSPRTEKYTLTEAFERGKTLFSHRNVNFRENIDTYWA